GPADKIQQPAARDEVMHQMAAWPEPRLVAALETEFGDALRRDQSAIRDAAGKLRVLSAEQQLAHRGMDAVGADKNVGLDNGAVGEARLDRIAMIDEAGEAMAEMDARLWQPGGDDRLQIGAMHGEVRGAVKLVAQRVKRGLLQRPAVVPA